MCSRAAGMMNLHLVRLVRCGAAPAASPPEPLATGTARLGVAGQVSSRRRSATSPAPMAPYSATLRSLSEKALTTDKMLT